MIVQPAQLAALDWAAAAAGTLARPWKVGSIVSGRVLEQALGTRLVLQINGLDIEADPLSTGLVPRQFQARVLAYGPQPILELLEQTAASKSPPTAPALRALLPQQGGLQPLLADLRALERTPGARALPEPVRVALARLEASISDRHDVLDPGVLRDTLRRGGQQLESTLLQHARAPERLPATQIDYDMKAALQRLTQALQQLPQDATTAQVGAPNMPMRPATPPPMPVPAPFAAALAMATAPAPAEVASPPPAPGAPAAPAQADTPPPLLQLPLQPQARVPAPDGSDALVLAAGMLKHAQAALSRIEIMQLEAHPSASPQAWMIEVPIRDDDGFDVLQLRFEQEPGGGPADPAAARWTLGFTLDPAGLGAIHGRIRLRGVQVDVDLWAQNDAAVQALEEQTSVLSQLLEGSGLRLAQLRVRQGTPLRHTGLGHSLLEASA